MEEKQELTQNMVKINREFLPTKSSFGRHYFLKTLPNREIICGYAEILKHSLISSKKFFLYLDKNVKNILKLKSPFIEKAIFESCKIKKKIVQKDETENNLRKF